MKFCSNCHSEIDEKAKYCPNCGYQVTITEPETAKKEEFQVKETKVQEEETKQSAEYIYTFTNKKPVLKRVIQLMLNPKEEWPLIASEIPGRMKILKSYVIPLSLIPLVISIIFLTIIEAEHSFAYVIFKAIIAFILPILVIYLTSFVLDKIAPSFESSPDFERSFQLLSYAFTPVWVLSIFSLIPKIYWFIHLAAFAYIVYQLIIGLPLLRSFQRDKATGVSILMVAIMFMMYLIFGLILTRIFL